MNERHPPAAKRNQKEKAKGNKSGGAHAITIGKDKTRQKARKSENTQENHNLLSQRLLTTRKGHLPSTRAMSNGIGNGGCVLRLSWDSGARRF